MSILCVIPARGGSKGVPRKNLRVVAGRPLIEWTIQQALACAHDLDVVVSTEDEEIAEVARAAGARVPFLRPGHLAQDTSATEPVVRHAIDEVSAAGRPTETVMLLQATSPIRLPGTLDRAVSEFAESGADSMVGVVAEAPFFWRAGTPPTPDYDVTRRPRRQDLTAADLHYRETGSLYLTRTAVYERDDNRLGGRVALFVMDEVEGIDIDSEVDLAVAEHTLRSLEDLEDRPR